MDHFADNKEISVYEGASTSVEKTLASLFQPDTLVHDEYFEVFRRKTYLEPEKELILFSRLS